MAAFTWPSRPRTARRKSCLTSPTGPNTTRKVVPDGFTQFQPLKWYTGEELINYMAAGDKDLSVYWDDWKLYLNKAP